MLTDLPRDAITEQAKLTSVECHMKDERAVWAGFKRHLPPKMMRRRIEDASGNLGTWDTFLSMGGKSNWLELKHEGPMAKPQLRPGQAAFGRDLFDAGLRSGYLVGSTDGSVRLIGQLTMGGDWREHLIFKREAMDADTVRTVLDYLGLGGQ